ncbi:MAG: PA14 domain-containing protein [Arenicellales bacterium]
MRFAMVSALKPICRSGIARAVLALVVLLVSTKPGWAVDPIVGAAPFSPQPAAAQIKPGLAVTYSYERYVHVDELETLRHPVIGEPLANIAHRTRDGNVLTANQAMLVGAHIRGIIHFDSVGTYVFRIESNDGVKAKIGGQQIWIDPEIHGNRWSPPLPVVIDAPGWYELWINYYQKKGTSALQLKWTPPGAAEEVLVPPDVLAHVESQVGQ